jgi:hypothetical protein
MVGHISECISKLIDRTCPDEDMTDESDDGYPDSFMLVQCFSDDGTLDSFVLKPVRYPLDDPVN